MRMWKTSSTTTYVSPPLGPRGLLNWPLISAVPKSHTRRRAIRSLRRMLQQHLRSSSSSPFFSTTFQVSKQQLTQPPHTGTHVQNPRHRTRISPNGLAQILRLALRHRGRTLSAPRSAHDPVVQQSGAPRSFGEAGEFVSAAVRGG